MKKPVRISEMLLTLLALGACAGVPPAATAPAKTLQNSGYGQAHPGSAKEQQQFGQFAGRWECTMNERNRDGEWRARPSKINWTWFYTLDGLAVQDIWKPESTGGTEDIVATNLRVYDRTLGRWNVAWTNTAQAQFEIWSGGKQGDELVLTSTREQRPVRIRFYNILPRRFQWAYEAAITTAGNEYAPVLQMSCQKLD